MRRQRQTSSKSRFGVVFVVLLGAMLLISSFNGAPKLGFLDRLKKKEVVPEPIEPQLSKNIGEVVARSAVLAAGALCVRRGVQYCNEKLSDGSVEKLRMQVYDGVSEMKQRLKLFKQRLKDKFCTPSVADLKNLTDSTPKFANETKIPSGNLFMGHSMLLQKDITEDLEVLTTGNQATMGCSSPLVSISFMGVKDLIVNATKAASSTRQANLDKMQVSAAFNALLALETPTVLMIQTRRPLSRSHFISILSNALTSWYPRYEAGQVKAVVKGFTKSLETFLEKKIPTGTQLRFDMLSRSPTPDEGKGLMHIVEVLIDGKPIALLQSGALKKQLLRMVMGPKPLSKSAKQVFLTASR
eukprot:CAMPEP_0167755104 /NCGR_PEP_ID=MMETSP0110_2-20121227/8636_1 /TAXON_ID=629695 /ORGANISM="Gymnochlora sp., Strain CCMP2014" /LENGTH=355 /DNA_ID=CAMNT_0007641049 /DNA_START=113 /DNA_END=1180 /DNA_ORIENTATION=+